MRIGHGNAESADALTYNHPIGTQATPLQSTIVGAYRSGTTLLEKIVACHPDAAIFSQPFPFLYIDTKRRFLSSIGADDRYPLGPRFRDRRYTTDDFVSYLDATPLTAREIQHSFRRMSGYSGFLTPELSDVVDELNGGCLHEVQASMHIRLAQRFRNQQASVVGSKEILVEEYIPYLIHHKVKVVVVVRDPRSVVASISYGQGQKWAGSHRPVLFHIRNWRKSAAYALAFGSDPRVFTVGFESLLANPIEVLNSVGQFLELDPAGFPSPGDLIVDQRGNQWRANTSFDSVDTVAERWQNTLDDRTTRFVEMCTLPEMAALGYRPALATAFELAAAERFQEPFEIRHPDFPSNFSTQAHNLADEQGRFDLVSDSDLSEADASEWFLFRSTHDKLLQAFEDRTDL